MVAVPPEDATAPSLIGQRPPKPPLPLLAIPRPRCPGTTRDPLREHSKETTARFEAAAFRLLGVRLSDTKLSQLLNTLHEA